MLRSEIIALSKFNSRKWIQSLNVHLRAKFKLKVCNFFVLALFADLKRIKEMFISFYRKSSCMRCM